MDNYSVEVKPSALKELEALPDAVLARIVKKIESLGQAPRPAGCKKLKHFKDQWRVRPVTGGCYTLSTTRRS